MRISYSFFCCIKKRRTTRNKSTETLLPDKTICRSADNIISPDFTRAKKIAKDVVEIPLHGRIAAGLPIEALEGQSSLSVPAALLGSGEHYALEVSGDSMVEAGILDGDYALVRRTDVARDGEIVVALLADEEANLQYFTWEGYKICPHPATRHHHTTRNK